MHAVHVAAWNERTRDKQETMNMKHCAVEPSGHGPHVLAPDADGHRRTGPLQGLCAGATNSALVPLWYRLGTALVQAVLGSALPVQWSVRGREDAIEADPFV